MNWIRKTIKEIFILLYEELGLIIIIIKYIKYNKLINKLNI